MSDYEWRRLYAATAGFFLIGLLIGQLVGCGSEPPAPLIDNEIAAHCEDMGRTYDPVLQACN